MLKMTFEQETEIRTIYAVRIRLQQIVLTSWRAHMQYLQNAVEQGWSKMTPQEVIESAEELRNDLNESIEALAPFPSWYTPKKRIFHQ